MKRPILFLLSSFLLIIIMILVALRVPHSLPTNSDFNAVYTASVALMRGAPIYDIPAVKAVAAEALGVPVEKFFLAPFPYPPWYALSTFYLGLLPIQQAALLWFEINLVLVFLSIWFLTDGWNGRLRLTAFPLGLFFIPVIGALSVGQNVFPVLLGGSMLVYALRKENVALVTLGSVLVTYKPHIGALILLSALWRLIAGRSDFGRRATRSILLAGVFLFFIGFLADPAWHIRYPQMLLGITSVNYGSESTGALCSNCTSLPVLFSRWFFDGTLLTAALVALTLLIILSALIFQARSRFSKEPALLLNLALVSTLLVSPYLFNYDFVLLLIPFAILLDKKYGVVQNVVVILCYLIPTLAIAIYGRDGNITLNVVTIVITFLLFARTRHAGIDVTASASYNGNN
ncbi:MAG TPA: glycosyltransferase family 87 protein [Anaerolineales bacterium]|nr:glycosyltransferase family 87 protein [Anaerolineales bacterium]